jgi:hypothetical protein
MDKKQIFMIAAIAFTVVMIVLELLRRSRQNRITNELTRYMLTGDFERFDALADDPATVKAIHPFNLAHSRFSSYLLRNDAQKITESFDDLSQRRLNSNQKLAIAQMGFSYFVSQYDQTRSTWCRDVISSLSRDEAVKDNTDMLYEILIEKKADRLDQLLERNETLPTAQRSSNEYLISEIYANLGDEKNRKKYEKMASRDLEASQRQLNR